jgi:hypothetical protein
MKQKEISLSAQDIKCSSGFKVVGKKVYMIWGKSETTGLNRIMAIEQTMLTDKEVAELGLNPKYAEKQDGNFAMIYAVAQSSRDAISECLSIGDSEKYEIKMGIPYYKMWGAELGHMIMDDGFWKTHKEVEILREQEKNYDDSDND